MQDDERGEDECWVGGVEEDGAGGGGEELLRWLEYLLVFLSEDKYLDIVGHFPSEILAAHLKALCWGSLHGWLERPGASRKGPIDT